MKKILRAKHWQLFLLTFGLQLVTQITFMVIMVSSIIQDPQEFGNPFAVFGIIKYFFVILLIVMSIYFSWYWAVGTHLQEFIPEGNRRKTKFFKVTILTPLLYFFLVFMLIAIFVRESFFNDPNFVVIGILAVFGFLLHFFSIFCIFYNVYFVAKTIKTAELQREAVFGEYIGEFFLILIFPIGIWFIQPRINRMVQKDMTDF